MELVLEAIGVGGLARGRALSMGQGQGLRAPWLEERAEEAARQRKGTQRSKREARETCREWLRGGRGVGRGGRGGAAPSGALGRS